MVMALAMAWSAVTIQHRRIYPVSDSRILVKEFTIPDHWPRGYGLDIHWNKVAVIWGALDPQTDTLYLYSEYEAEADSAIHAAAIRSRGSWIIGLCDPTANDRTEFDGLSLIQAYQS